MVFICLLSFGFVVSGTRFQHENAGHADIFSIEIFYRADSFYLCGLGARAYVLARAGAYMRTRARVLVVMSTPKQTLCQLC
jgi:hypothetical protein